MFGKKFEKLYKTFNDALNVEKLAAICNCCGKLLFKSNKMLLLLTEEIQFSFVKPYYRDNDGGFVSIENGKHVFCFTCFNYVKTNQCVFVFDNYGEIPAEIHNLRGYSDYNQLALCSLLCNTFRPCNYSYWHLNGHMNVIAKKKEQVEGTFGIILSNSSDCDPDRSKIALALKWLKKNNMLYDSFISLGERIDGYYDHSGLNSYYKSFPTLNDDIKSDSVDLKLNYGDEEGLIINVDEAKVRDGGLLEGRIKMGMNIERVSDGLGIKKDVYLYESETEAKLFPHLFPYGKGYWLPMCRKFTVNKYFKMRLMHFDPRWRDDSKYLFYAFDRINKERIGTVNRMIKMRANLAEDRNIENVTKNYYEDYYKFGNFVPKSITGSKSYWKSKYYDLVAIINDKGIWLK
jgi:hypothetical protein